jgi:Protein of unknown function (DUF3592)
MSPRSKINDMLPPELLRPGSHAVRLSAGGIVLAVLAGVLFVGGLFLSLGLYVRASGPAQSTTGEVLEFKRERVRYRYTVHGQTYTGEHEAPGSARALEPHAELPVRYSLKDPRRSWIGRKDEVALWVPPFVAVSFAAGPLAMLWAVRREWTLLANGRATVGRVLASRKIHKGGGHGSKTRYRLTVEYRVLSGALRTARFDRRRDVQVGGNVTVVYDRDDPGRSQSYPFRLVRPV